MGVISLHDRRYSRLTEQAAKRTRETGCVDLCDLAEAAAQGFDTNTFANDALSLAHSEEDY